MIHCRFTYVFHTVFVYLRIPFIASSFKIYAWIFYIGDEYIHNCRIKNTDISHHTTKNAQIIKLNKRLLFATMLIDLSRKYFFPNLFFSPMFNVGINIFFFKFWYANKMNIDNNHKFIINTMRFRWHTEKIASPRTNRTFLPMKYIRDWCDIVYLCTPINYFISGMKTKTKKDVLKLWRTG